MKIILGFFSGIMVSGLLLLGVQTALPISADSESLDMVASENFSLAKMLPDLEKIYHEALTAPFREAGKKIYDDDIAQYYDLLLKKTALDSPQSETN